MNNRQRPATVYYETYPDLVSCSVTSLKNMMVQDQGKATRNIAVLNVSMTVYASYV